MVRAGLVSFLMLAIYFGGCKKDSPIETGNSDSQAPTVSIVIPTNGSTVKADTIYTIVADAKDNAKIITVEFYINSQKCGSDSLAPFEYRWSTNGLTNAQTIFAKAYDEAGNIGTSESTVVIIHGVANHPPTIPSSPWPADSAAWVSTSPTLSWNCNDPDYDEVTYDVFWGIRRCCQLQ